jgi:hypothetical protein
MAGLGNDPVQVFRPCNPQFPLPATQVQSGGGIVDTGKPTGQAVDGNNQRDRLPTGDWPAVFGLDLKEPGYKVAWIEKSVQRLLLIIGFFQGDFAPLAPPHPGHVLVAISNQQVCSN